MLLQDCFSVVTLSFNREKRGKNIKSFLLSAFESACEVFFSYFNDYSCFTGKRIYKCDICLLLTLLSLREMTSVLGLLSFYLQLCRFASIYVG